LLYAIFLIETGFNTYRISPCKSTIIISMDINAFIDNQIVQLLAILSAFVALFEYIIRFVKKSINDDYNSHTTNIICDECNKNISINALSCPNCGSTEIFDPSIQLNKIYNNLFEILNSFIKNKPSKKYIYKLSILLSILVFLSFITIIIIFNKNIYNMDSYSIYYSYSILFTILILVYDEYSFNSSSHSECIFKNINKINSNIFMLKERYFYSSENMEKDCVDVKYICNFILSGCMKKENITIINTNSYIKVFLVIIVYISTSHYILGDDFMKPLSGPPFVIVLFYIFPLYISSQKSNNSNYTSSVEKVSYDIRHSLKLLDSWCRKNPNKTFEGTI